MNTFSAKHVAEAIALSLAANLIILYFAKPFAPDLQVLSALAIVPATTIGVLGAAVAFWYIRKRFQNPERLFVRVALVALVLSIIPNILLFFVTFPGLTGVTAGGIWALMSMHAVVAVIVVSVFVWRRGTTPRIS